MSVSLDDLVEKYHEAWSAIARQTDGDRQTASRAGVRAIVSELQNEFDRVLPCDRKFTRGEVWMAFDRILSRKNK